MMDTLHTVLRSIRGETKSRRDHVTCSANSSTTSTASAGAAASGQRCPAARGAGKPKR